MMAEKGKDKIKEKEDELSAYKAAFDTFDWNRNGTIPTKDLQWAMRRAGQNPTDVEVQDMINKIDDGSGYLDFSDFCLVMQEKSREFDEEMHFKDTFRVFSKDVEGCIPADELKFVMKHLPGKVTYKEIEEMIKIVDKNEDGKISYSEFRVMMGGFPLLIDINAEKIKIEGTTDKDKDENEKT